MHQLTLPVLTTATGAFLLVQVLVLNESIRRQSAAVGNADQLVRATTLIAVVVLLVGVVEVAVSTTRTVVHRTSEIGVLGATGVPRLPVVVLLVGVVEVAVSTTRKVVHRTSGLVQGIIASTMIVVLHSQASLAEVFLYLQGALTVIWLASGYFFFIPLAIARWKYADRYASEDFWRIPGGRPAAVAVSVVGTIATTVGIYYTYTLPFSADIAKADWMTWVGVTVAVFVAAAALVYIFGRRSAAVLDAPGSLSPPPSA